jgi:hypothetical protein
MRAKLFILMILLFGLSNTCFSVQDFYLKKSDTGPYYYIQLIDSNGAIDLTGTTLTCSMKSVTGTAKISNASMVVTDTANGMAEYRWTSSDTSWPNTYLFEVYAVIGGVRYTFPTRGQARIIIYDNFTY